MAGDRPGGTVLKIHCRCCSNVVGVHDVEMSSAQCYDTTGNCFFIVVVGMGRPPDRSAIEAPPHWLFGGRVWHRATWGHFHFSFFVFPSVQAGRVWRGRRLTPLVLSCVLSCVSLPHLYPISIPSLSPPPMRPTHRARFRTGALSFLSSFVPLAFLFSLGGGCRWKNAKSRWTRRARESSACRTSRPP